MSTDIVAHHIPNGYRRLEGSERRPAPGARRLGPADVTETFDVTLVLRRRPDGPPMPDFTYFATTPPGQRPRLSEDEFASKYGASATDIDRVTAFAKTHGLSVVEANAARRSIAVSGTVAQMSKAFAVTLGHYEHPVVRRRHAQPHTETYRGRDGFIYVPEDVGDAIIGVFGLDNRRITKRNGADPQNTGELTIPTITQLYNFPTNSAAGQTIAIFAERGYLLSDLQDHFGTSTPPVLPPIAVAGPGNVNPSFETTQDICIAGSAAPGAKIQVYLTTYDQNGWAQLIQRVIQPQTGDPICSVLSCSFYVSDGDDAATLANEGVSSGWVTAVHMWFEDAAVQGVTVCVATGDTGSDSMVGASASLALLGYTFPPDGKAHVQYPASDPWVLSVGGTTVGNVSGASFDEYVWNDTTTTWSEYSGYTTWPWATGGGVSDFFTSTSQYASAFAYQANAGVPPSVNDGHMGRSLPDVCANASPNSGYPIPFKNGPLEGLPNPCPSSGTSAAAPLWAGLIAVLNAALHENIGFINPFLYAHGSGGLRNINSVQGPGAEGPSTNGCYGITGYQAVQGWNACTGWGSPNGQALLSLLETAYQRSHRIRAPLRPTPGLDPYPTS